LSMPTDWEPCPGKTNANFMRSLLDWIVEWLTWRDEEVVSA
jgi:hypothetical protein